MHSNVNINSTMVADADLLIKYKQSGNLEFIGELYKRYAKQILSVCIYYFKDKDTAKDHVMQIFDKLIIELKNKDIDNFKGWLSFVVRNYCISIIRKQKSSAKKHEAYSEYELTILNEETELKLETMKIQEINKELVVECLKELKDAQRECIELFYLKNKSYQEIAELKKLTLNDVKSFIQNGKRNLKLLFLEKQKTLLNPTKR